MELSHPRFVLDPKLPDGSIKRIVFGVPPTTGAPTVAFGIWLPTLIRSADSGDNNRREAKHRSFFIVPP